MTTISAHITRKDKRRLMEVLDGNPKQLARQLPIIVNKVARKVRSSTKHPKGISQRVREHLAVKAKDLKPLISIVQKATRKRPVAIVALKRTASIPLRKYRARQTNVGVSYTIDKRKGRQTLPSAFGPGPKGKKKPGRIDKLGGNVFTREGKARLPIKKRGAVSPYAFYLKNKINKRQKFDTQVALYKAVRARVRFLLLKRRGAI